MGVDFVTTCAKSFEKSWDKNLKELAHPSLFTQIPAGERRTFLAVPRGGRVITSGRWYEIVMRGADAVIMDGLECVGDFHDLPKSHTDLIQASAGGAALAYVHRILTHSGMAEVTME